VAVNPVTNKVYVANNSDNNVTVIDGVTNAPTTIAAGANPRALVVNPATNKVYVANYGSANVTAVTPQAAWLAPLIVNIAPLPGNVSRTATPSFTLTPLNQYMPNPTGVQQVYYQVDTWQDQWLTATDTGSNQWIAT